MTGQAIRTRIHLRAKDVMISPVITVRPDTPVKDIAAAMVTHHVSGLPVVTSDGELVGIVTEADLIHKESDPFGQAPGFFAGLPAFGGTAAVARKADGLFARDLMTSPVVTVEEKTPLRSMAALMMRRKINRLPVLRARRLIGIVSRADLVRALVRPDDEIASDVRAVLLHELWVDTGKMRIDVRGGIAYLSGEVDRHSEKELVERSVLSIDGVVGVESTLTFGFDDRAMRSRNEERAARVTR